MKDKTDCFFIGFIVGALVSALAIAITLAVIAEKGITDEATPAGEWSKDAPYIEPMFMRIKHLQMDLEAAGFDPCGIDGIYGDDTDKAWNAYETWYMERAVE